MNKLVITQINKGFMLELNETKLFPMNETSLRWHLKHRLKLSKFDIASVMTALDSRPIVSIDLDLAV